MTYCSKRSVPVFVVSLERSSKRRQEITVKLAGLGIQFSFIDAVDAQLVGEEWLQTQVDVEAVLANLGKKLSPPEIGCALSHRKAYQQIIESNLPGAVILEDDVDIADDILGVLAHFQTEGDLVSDRKIIIHLGALSMPSGRYLMLSRSRRWIVSPSVTFAEYILFARRGSKLAVEPWGTFGYYITRAAAESLLMQDRLQSAADHWSLWARNAAGRIYVSIPSVVIHPHDLSDSEIERARMRERRKTGSWRAIGLWIYGGVRARIIRMFLKPLIERLNS